MLHTAGQPAVARRIVRKSGICSPVLDLIPHFYRRHRASEDLPDAAMRACQSRLFFAAPTAHSMYLHAHHRRELDEKNLERHR